MELLKIWRHGVSGELYRKKAIEYALDERKVIWQCYGVQTDFPYTIFDQMKIVSDLWGNNGKNPVFHFVISFEKRTVDDPYVAMAYVKRIFEHLLPSHQIVISIHKEDHLGSLYHAHVVMSTTNFLNGDLFQNKRDNFFRIGQNVADLTHHCCLFELPRPEENKGSNEDMVQDQNGDQKEDKKKNKKYIRIFTPKW